MLKSVLRILKTLYFNIKYRETNVSFSSNVSSDTELAEGVKILTRARIGSCKIGKFTYIGSGCNFSYTEIGSFCSIGPEVLCGLGKHPIDFVTTYPGFYSQRASGAVWFGTNHDFPEENQTIISHDVWVGARAIIMGGITIGTGAIVAAGAVVTKDVPPYAIVAGVPAKVLKFRFDNSTMQALLSSKWWQLDNKQLRYLSAQIDNPTEFLATLSTLTRNEQQYS